MKKTYMKPEMATAIVNSEFNLLAGSGSASSTDGTTLEIHDTGATGAAEGNENSSVWDD